MKKRNIILDCDTKNEIDDQFAIVYALNDPEINLLGVVSVQNTKTSGKNSVEIYHNEARKILRLCNSKIPAFKGSKQPLVSKDKPEKSLGVDFIINTVLNSKEKIYVVGTGPCTDLVNACLIEPKIKKKCVFVWLGGFKNNEIAKKNKWEECNFNGDKLGAKILVELGINLILLPAKGVASSMVRSSDAFIGKLEKRKNSITNYLIKLIKSMNVSWGSWIFWDLAAPAITKDFGIINKKKIHPYKVLNGKMIFQNKGRKITIIDSIDDLKILSQAEKYILK